MKMMKVYKNNWFTNAVNLFKSLEWELPTIQTKVYTSSLDEAITTEKTIEGKELKTFYKLTASERSKHFKYFYTLKTGDDINEIRSNAHKQYDAWKLQIKDKIENYEQKEQQP